MSRFLMLLSACLVSACASAEAPRPFTVEPVASFDEPWAMAFLPDGRLLVTEKAGRLLVVDRDGNKSAPISGLPAVDYGGQGGLGDVALHPDFADNRLVYISYVEAGDDDTRGAAVARGVLELDGNGGTLSGLEVIWRQLPKVTGRGHYGHRLLFDGAGHLFISSGERQKFDPAQDMAGNLGKILRLHDDGSVPKDNPFYDDGGVTAQIWSLGHRNPLGIAFDLDGQLWNVEMGPKGGDELNRVVRGENYGYPIVSNGDHYNGEDIPRFRRAASWFTTTGSLPTGAVTASSPACRPSRSCGSSSTAQLRARQSASTWANACARSCRGRTERSGCSKTSGADACCGSHRPGSAPGDRHKYGYRAARSESNIVHGGGFDDRFRRQEHAARGRRHRGLRLCHLGQG
jgi:hypothetical protein